MSVNNKGPDGRDMFKNGLDPVAKALKRLHDDVLAEPVPNSFLDLLDRIDERQAEGPR